MKKLLISTIILLSVLSGCGDGKYYSDEEVINKRIDEDVYYRKGKKYSDQIYFIETNKREYILRTVNNTYYPSTIYHSYNEGDKVIFYDETGANRMYIYPFRLDKHKE